MLEGGLRSNMQVGGMDSNMHMVRKSSNMQVAGIGSICKWKE